MLYKSSDELIGKTPLLEATHLEKELNLPANIFLKLEYFNPTGSIKDRAAFYMVKEAEKKGLLKPGATIIEPTSGNTGIGLGLISAINKYKLILVMPENMSEERQKILKAYGAEIVLTPKEEAMNGSIKKAQELAKEIPGSFIPSQFDNYDNCLAHYETTGPEIYKDLDGKVDAFVAGVGTGGTFSGVSKYLKEKNKNIKCFTIEPATSAVISGEKMGSHNIQGIGAGFVPKNFDKNLCDDVIKISDNDSIITGKLLGKKEGLLCGISTGAALFAALQLAFKPEFKGKNIVVICPDSGDRYYSTELFSD